MAAAAPLDAPHEFRRPAVVLSNLDSRVTPELVEELCSYVGIVTRVSMSSSDPVPAATAAVAVAAAGGTNMTADAAALRRRCYVDFTDDATATYATIVLDQQPLWGRPLQVRHVTKCSAPGQICIHGLSPDTRAADIVVLFATAGNIADVRVIREESGQSKCFAFVSYWTVREAFLAIRLLDGASLGGRTVQVSQSREMREQLPPEEQAEAARQALRSAMSDAQEADNPG